MAEKIGLEAVLDMTDFNKGVSTYISSTTQMNSQTNIFATALGGLSPVMSTITHALGNILSNAFNAVVGAIQSAVSAVIDFGKESVKLATSFQEQMAILSVAASGAGPSMQELKDAAIAVGGDTTLLGVSAVGAADAMTGLYKAGLTTTEIFGDLQGYLAGTADLGGALRAAIDLAAASELDMVAASDLAAITLASFGGQMETEEERANFVTLAMNNFVQAADASVASVSDLAAAMMNVAPTAAAMGIDIYELNNALAIMSTRGISGAEAGTALKSMLTNMQRPTAAVSSALNELGIELYNSEGIMNSLPDIISQFERAMVGMTQEQKNQYVQTIAGTYGMNAMNVLLQEGTEGWDAMAKATAKAAGIQVQSEARAATFAGKMEALEGVMETLKIQIGDAFLPVLTELASWFSTMIEQYGPKIANVFEVVGAALSGLFSAISGGGSVGGALALFFADLGFAELGGVINWVVSLFQREVIPIFTVTLPAALSVAGSFWTGTLLPALQGVWSFIQNSIIPIFQVVVGWFQQMIPVAIQVATDYFNLYLLPVFNSISEQWTTTLQPALAELWTWLQENIPVAIAFLGTVWETNLKPALAALGAFVADILIPALSQLAAWFISNIPVAIEAVSTAWYTVLYPAFSAAWAFVAETLIPILGDVVLWLQENIPIATQALATFWEEVLLPALQQIWAYIQDNILPIFDTVVLWLQENIPLAIQTLTTFWTETLLPALAAVWDYLTNYVIPLWAALYDLFTVSLSLAIDALALLWTGVLLPALQGVWAFIDENLMPIFETIVKYLVDTFAPTLNTIKTGTIDALALAFDAVKNAIQWVIDKVVALTEKLSGLKVPKAFDPGSPPPFYYALKDISAAMNDLSVGALPKLGMELTRNLDNVVSPQMGQAPMQNIVNNTRQVNAPINATINNNMDMFAFQARIQQAVAGAL